MPQRSSPFTSLRRRLSEAETRAQRYQAEGLPFPISQLLMEYDQAVRAGDANRAEAVVKRAEMLLARADQDWRWHSELLQRVDGLRAIADTVGLDLARIDAQVGNPRGQLLNEPLTPASLEKAAAGASFALAVLNDALPKYIVQEAQVLGASIRRARDRGEDVREAAAAFSALLRSLQEPVLGTSAERLVVVRRAVARIPRAPTIAAVSPEEEDEILREARNLARRLHRIKTSAHDAGDAVRLITQVRQALSEDRRYVSPEEEVEALWAEVDRLTKEKRLATGGPALGSPAAEGSEEESDEEEPEESEPVGPGAVAVPPPEYRIAANAVPTTPSISVPPRERASRLPLPIVPPVRPLADEQAGVPRPQSPDSLADGAGPRIPRPTRIAIASAYVPPDMGVPPAPPPAPSPPATAPPAPATPPAAESAATPEQSPPVVEDTRPVLPPPGPPARRARSRHRD